MGALLVKVCLIAVLSLKGQVFSSIDRPVAPVFIEVSQEAKLLFFHVNGASPQKYIVETVGSGAGFLDYDNDGWMDVYFVNGGPTPATVPAVSAANQLFRNNRDGTFTEVTEKAGVGDTSYGVGCAFADYDNDGYVDIYVTNLGPNLLYHNNGDGTFTEIASKAGVADRLWGTSAAFADYDQDGNLDLYVCNYLQFSFAGHRRCYVQDVPIYCYPHSYEGAPNALYRNNGDGTFADITAIAGVREDPQYSKSLGVIWLDMDGDGDVDLYVANDTTANYLFENKGNATFEDLSLVSGTAFSGAGVPQAGMGIDATDLDGNGSFDIFVTNFSLQHNALYWNDGSGIFSDRILESNLAGPGFLPLAFGTNFLDYDNDGLVDLFVANGHVFDNAEMINPSLQHAQANQLFRHLGQGRFLEISSQAGAYFSRKNVSRGSAAGDFNNDGKLDLLVTNKNDRADLLENRTASPHQWLKFKLEGADCNRDAVGAKIALTAGAYRLTQEVRAGSSYLSQSDLRLHFGLGDRTRIDTIQVSWPCGKTQNIVPPQEFNRIIHLKEE